jgi:hypothetical protein
MVVYRGKYAWKGLKTMKVPKRERISLKRIEVESLFLSTSILYSFLLKTPEFVLETFRTILKDKAARKPNLEIKMPDGNLVQMRVPQSKTRVE